MTTCVFQDHWNDTFQENIGALQVPSEDVPSGELPVRHVKANAFAVQKDAEVAAVCPVCPDR